MGDLISRNELIYKIRGIVPGSQDVDFIIGLIENQPTAYDVEKVVAELEKRKEESLQLWKKYNLTDDAGKMFAFDESIKIVKVGGKTEKVDCHYCQYACCGDENSDVDCCVEDFAYFDHHVTDSKEAEECGWFRYCDSFPKY